MDEVINSSDFERTVANFDGNFTKYLLGLLDKLSSFSKTDFQHQMLNIVTRLDHNGFYGKQLEMLSAAGNDERWSIETTYWKTNGRDLPDASGPLLPGSRPNIVQHWRREYISIHHPTHFHVRLFFLETLSVASSDSNSSAGQSPSSTLNDISLNFNYDKPSLMPGRMFPETSIKTKFTLPPSPSRSRRKGSASGDDEHYSLFWNASGCLELRQN